MLRWYISTAFAVVAFGLLVGTVVATAAMIRADIVRLDTEQQQQRAVLGTVSSTLSDIDKHLTGHRQ